ncbi:hypothetical protein [Nocardioides dilutus]
MAGTTNEARGQDVFDVANWLDRASGRVDTPAPSAESAPPPATYAPRHRADVPVDSVASVA